LSRLFINFFNGKLFNNNDIRNIRLDDVFNKMKIEEELKQFSKEILKRLEKDIKDLDDCFKETRKDRKNG